MVLDTARMILGFDGRPFQHVATSAAFLSYFGLALSFFVLRPLYSTSKQISWIITTIAAAVMSVASLPFLWDFSLAGGDVRNIRELSNYSLMVNRFFQAYLALDLMIGAVFYRSQVSILEGWLHHPTYILIIELAIRCSWSHIFCLCGAMEIPTFILGISTLHPQLRSNVFFAVAFFMTRILFHLALAVSYFSLENRVHTTGGSFIPAALLAGVFPLHLMWFVGCIKGFIRRARKADFMPPSPRFISLDIIPGENIHTPPTHRLEKSTSQLARQHVKNLPHRRRSCEQSIRPFQLDILDLHLATSTPLSKVSFSGKVASYIPPRETLYDYVGLGRTSQGPSARRTVSNA